MKIAPNQDQSISHPENTKKTKIDTKKDGHSNPHVLGVTNSNANKTQGNEKVCEPNETEKTDKSPTKLPQKLTRSLRKVLSKQIIARS